jgi:protein involved in polysaccharide export with SLBB domain
MPVSVIGAVNKPGALTYQHGLRLSDYVGLAGGPTNRARVRDAVLKRAGPDDDAAIRKLDLAAALGDPDDPKLNPILEPGDVVTVPEEFLGGTLEWSDVLRALAAVFIWK